MCPFENGRVSYPRAPFHTYENLFRFIPPKHIPFHTPRFIPPKHIPFHTSFSAFLVLCRVWSSPCVKARKGSTEAHVGRSSRPGGQAQVVSCL